MVWYPRDPKERSRIVVVLAIVWHPPWGLEASRKVWAIVRETDRRLPGVALVSLSELGKERKRKDTAHQITGHGCHDG